MVPCNDKANCREHEMGVTDASQSLGTDVWAHALERAGLGVWDWNLPAGTCLYSDTWFRMLGYEPGELPQTGDLWVTLMHPEDRDNSIATGERHLRGETPLIEVEMRLRHKAGHWVWVLDRGGVVERDEAGNPLRVVGVQTDISSQKASEAALSAVKERFSLALSASRTGIWYYDIGTQFSFWDVHTHLIMGLPPKEGTVPSKTWIGFLHPDDREEAIRTHGDLSLFDHGDRKMRYRIVRPDGEVRHLETLARFSSDPAPHGSIVGTVRDVTEEVMAAEALRIEEHRLRVTLASISDGVVSADQEGRITFANPAASEMLGLAADSLIGRQSEELFSQHARIVGLPEFDARAAGLIVLPGADGQGILVRCTTNSISRADGLTRGFVHTLLDVTDEQKTQRELAYAARHDSLTSLFNRSAFEEVLETRVVMAEASPFALLYIDLDHFKALNDFAGHAAGDRALVLIARSIVDSLPAGSVVARLGGDEFAAIVDCTGDADAQLHAQAVLAAIRGADLGSNANYRRLGASVGIIVVSEKGLHAPDVLAHADDACYAAKSAGRNCLIAHTQDEGRLVSRLTAARLVGDIADAKEDGRLRLYGQEIRSLASPTEPGEKLEILARLVDRQGNSVPPGVFIPAAERFGRAAALDRWIIAKVLRDHGHIMRPGGLTVGFNLSAQTLSDATLWDYVHGLVQDCRASPQCVVFEITETAAVTNFEAAERFVRQARGYGCRISLDDFGAGLSSFDYLRRFPVDSLKINGSFIENLPTSRFDRQIVWSISRVARSLGYDVIAEKIENEATLGILANMNVQFGQGYLFHKPEPIEDIVRRRLDQMEPKVDRRAGRG
ncbi:EAL domain-containing protein [Aquibium carbonis]|uniref:EAL domain-containing protein n=2 Tax=Aquibium carbonis TaxID=2495581 RepID=A0A429YVD3_9HYPH|nr:EAL domain-containing protein [Aquibium carbonis]